MRLHHSHNRQRGFSLLEAVLAVALTLVVITFAVSFVRGALMKNGALEETRERNTRAQNFAEMLRSDLDTSGYNMMRLSNDGAGTEAVFFQPDPAYTNYVQTGANFTKTNTSLSWTYNGSAWDWYHPPSSTRGIGEGTGTVTWTIDPATIAQTNPNHDSYIFFRGTDNSWRGLIVGWYEGFHIDVLETGPNFAFWDGKTLERPSTSPFNDTFSLQIENTPTGNLLRYYRIARGSGARRLLYTSQHELPQYPISIGANFNTDGITVQNVTISGSTLVDIGGQPVTAPLPLSSEGRIPFPVTLHRNAAGNPDGFMIWRGDVRTDPMRLTRPYHAPDRVSLFCTRPARGTNGKDDRLLLVDYTARKSLLLYNTDDQIETTPDGNIGLSIAGVGRDLQTPYGWGLFSSDDSELAYTYPVGSTLIKLAAPVEYRWDGQDTLFRREGAGAWTIAAAGVSSFYLDEATSADSYSLHVQSKLLSDTNFISSDRTTPAPANFDQIFSPRALNTARLR